MNAANAQDLLNQEDVDGGLIGTAALDVEQFFADHSDRQPRRSATLTGQLPPGTEKGAMKTPTTLIILDGFALGEDIPGNAVQAAATPPVGLSLLPVPLLPAGGLRPRRGAP